ncbi:MAG TPA: sigma-70 family RNA polymerase sigma factor [Terriglobia bacterium]|nr:sigma-70 family RNA polymerase sigma factor [Terriglobia bacterium]
MAFFVFFALWAFYGFGCFNFVCHAPKRLHVAILEGWPEYSPSRRISGMGNKNVVPRVSDIGSVKRGALLQYQEKLDRFEQAILPHLDAAYNLARWLTNNDPDAEDVVQETYLRAFEFFEGFCGVDGRSWLLTIVRNTCFTWLRRNRPAALTTEFDEEIHSETEASANPEKLLMEKVDREQLQTALEELPVEFREALVLRELEGLSYKEIGDVCGVPVGTVMSRLARARDRLREGLARRLKKGAIE